MKSKHVPERRHDPSAPPVREPAEQGREEQEQEPAQRIPERRVTTTPAEFFEQRHVLGERSRRGTDSAKLRLA